MTFLMIGDLRFAGRTFQSILRRRFGGRVHVQLTDMGERYLAGFRAPDGTGRVTMAHVWSDETREDFLGDVRRGRIAPYFLPVVETDLHPDECQCLTCAKRFFECTCDAQCRCDCECGALEETACDHGDES